jgi:hypothetical protein
VSVKNLKVTGIICMKSKNYVDVLTKWDYQYSCLENDIDFGAVSLSTKCVRDE